AIEYLPRGRTPLPPRWLPEPTPGQRRGAVDDGREAERDESDPQGTGHGSVEGRGIGRLRLARLAAVPASIPEQVDSRRQAYRQREPRVPARADRVREVPDPVADRDEPEGDQEARASSGLHASIVARALAPWRGRAVGERPGVGSIRANPQAGIGVRD